MPTGCLGNTQGSLVSTNYFSVRETTFGSRLRRIRKEVAELSLKAFGQRINKKIGYLSELENDIKTNPGPEMLEKICTEFRVSREWLENGVGEMREAHHGNLGSDQLPYGSGDAGKDIVLSEGARETLDHLVEKMNDDEVAEEICEILKKRNKRQRFESARYLIWVLEQRAKKPGNGG